MISQQISDLIGGAFEDDFFFADAQLLAVDGQDRVLDLVGLVGLVLISQPGTLLGQRFFQLEFTFLFALSFFFVFIEQADHGITWLVSS